MRLRLKQSVTMLAVFAVALHTMLSAVAVPIAAAGTIDPFSVICHSGGATDGAPDQTSGAPVSKPTSVCDHCNLCSATGTPSTPDVVLLGRLLPERVLTLLSPSSAPRRDGVTSSPKLARGPPQLA